MIRLIVYSPPHAEARALASEPLVAAVSRRLSPRARGLLVAAVCGGVVVVCAWLHPAAGGAGTHEQLGMPPCSFLSRTGWPCPSCGMTTSMAAMAHGRVAAAWRAHPFGVALFAAVMAAGAISLAELASGRRVFERLRPRLWWVWAGLAGLAAGWGWKLAAGWASGAYPLP